MDNQELSEILQQHRRWILREDEGVRANLRFANLSGAKINLVNWHAG